MIALDSDNLAGCARNVLKPLFDKDGVYDILPSELPVAPMNPAKLLHDIEEFIRVMGLLPLALGRDEIVNAVTGLGHLRRILIEFMILEADKPNRGGALHLNRLITVEQRAVLTTLPPLLPGRDAVITAHFAYFNAFLPRARHLAKRYHVAWPEAFEAATWAHLDQSLGSVRGCFEPI